MLERGYDNVSYINCDVAARRVNPNFSPNGELQSRDLIHAGIILRSGLSLRLQDVTQFVYCFIIMVTEKLRWCSIEQVCQGVKCEAL